MTYESLLYKFVISTDLLTLKQKETLNHKYMASFTINYLKTHTYLSVKTVTNDFMDKVLNISARTKSYENLSRILKYNFTIIFKKLVKQDMIHKYNQKTYKSDIREEN